MTDQQLLSNVQYALVEPPDGGASYPCGLWTPAEVLAVLALRQHRFLKESLIHLLEVSLPVAATTRTVLLPADCVRIVSAVWQGSDGALRELRSSDQWEADMALSSWETPGQPLTYHEYDTPTLTLELAPVPALPGTLALLYVPGGAALTGVGAALSVIDEFAATTLKYGVLADLLSKDGRGRDPSRAKYAGDRFQLGIDLARLLIDGWA